jgi:hypothetical protein
VSGGRGLKPAKGVVGCGIRKGRGLEPGFGRARAKNQGNKAEPTLDSKSHETSGWDSNGGGAFGISLILFLPLSLTLFCSSLDLPPSPYVPLLPLPMRLCPTSAALGYGTSQAPI